MPCIVELSAIYQALSLGQNEPMKIYKGKWFVRFARKENISDTKLCEAVKNAEFGLIDADYGDGVIKQRIARPNKGKSGGYRSIILFRKEHRSFFVYGFSKKERENLDESEERDFKDLAKVLLDAAEADIVRMVEERRFIEVMCDEQDIQG